MSAVRAGASTHAATDPHPSTALHPSTEPRRPPQPRLTVVSGPAGVGKGTVVARLRAEHPEVFVSVSATTRAPRSGEVDGEHYLFVSEEEFDELVETDALLEWALVHGAARYGTPVAPVRAALAAGREAILEIEVQGARQIRDTSPESRFVFLAPPSWDELVRRLVGRGTETSEQRDRRLLTAQGEMGSMEEFDHVIVNGEVGQAVDDLVALLGL